MERDVTVEISARAPAGAWRLGPRGRAVAAMFGIDAERGGGAVLFERVRVPIARGAVVLLTGASGSGKSTMLRALRRGLSEMSLEVFELGAEELPGGRALVECFDGPVEDALRLLAMAGLSEARLLLRAPTELSEGQQFRFRLARFLASDADVLIADEFCGALDRVTARVVSWQLGKFIRASRDSTRPRAAIVATSHGDLIEDLRPAVTVVKGFGATVAIQLESEAGHGK